MVFPGNTSGHMGAVRQSVQNLEVIKIDVQRYLIAVRGAIPGASGGDVLIGSASIRCRGWCYGLDYRR